MTFQGIIVGGRKFFCWINRGHLVWIVVSHFGEPISWNTKYDLNSVIRGINENSLDDFIIDSLSQYREWRSRTRTSASGPSLLCRRVSAYVLLARLSAGTEGAALPEDRLWPAPALLHRPVGDNGPRGCGRVEQRGPQDTVLDVSRSGVLAALPYAIDAPGSDGLELIRLTLGGKRSRPCQSINQSSNGWRLWENKIVSEWSGVD